MKTIRLLLDPRHPRHGLFVLALYYLILIVGSLVTGGCAVDGELAVDQLGVDPVEVNHHGCEMVPDEITVTVVLTEMAPDQVLIDQAWADSLRTDSDRWLRVCNYTPDELPDAPVKWGSQPRCGSYVMHDANGWCPGFDFSGCPGEEP